MIKGGKHLQYNLIAQAVNKFSTIFIGERASDQYKGNAICRQHVGGSSRQRLFKKRKKLLSSARFDKSGIQHGKYIYCIWSSGNYRHRDNKGSGRAYLVLVVDGHRTGPNGARFVEAGQYLGDAAVRDEQLAGDIARTNAQQCQLHDAPAHVVRQRTAVHEHAAQLVHARLPYIIPCTTSLIKETNFK